MDTDATTPNAGRSSDAASDDFRIISVEPDDKIQLPMVEFYYRGKTHKRIDYAIYQLCIGTSSPKFGLQPHHAELIKQRGIECRQKNDLEPWPGEQHIKAPEQLHEAPRPAVDVDAIRAKSRKEAKKLPPPPKHELEILGDMFTDPNTGEASIKALRDGIEEIWSVFDLNTELENFPSEYDPHLSGIVHDMVIRTNAERFARAEAEHVIRWPEGGIEPITADTFTQAKAEELGIIYDDSKGRTHVNIHEAAAHIMRHISFARVSFDKSSKYVELRYFDRGKYYDQGKAQIEMAAERLLGEYSTNQRVAEVYGKIFRTYPPREPDDNDPEGWISVLNGYLNTRTRKLEPHHPGRVFTIQIPVEYRPGAKSEDFKRFLWQIMSPHDYHPTAIPSDDMLALEEMMGYCLEPGYPYQWFFILLGEGQNGKGVLLNVISALLGEDNVSAVPLQELDAGRDKFASSDIRGALANLCGDLSANELKNTGLVKRATGDDWIRAQQKGMAAFKFKNRAKMIFACNEMPYTRDETRGFTRRPRVFTFDQIFSSTSKVTADPGLLKKLTSPEQLSGILNIALDGLDRLRKNGALTGRGDEDFEIERFSNLQDTAGKFLNEHCVIDQAFVLDGRLNRAHKTGKKDLYEAYEAWCEAKGYPDVKDRDFNKRVIELFGEVVREGRWGEENPDEPNGRVWIGLRFEP